MSVATDLSNAEQEQAGAECIITGDAPRKPGVPAASVSLVRLDQINNWTGVQELPFDPIAERVLEIEAQDEQGKELKGELFVTFARPVLVEGQGWACLYRLSAMGRVHVSPARGADAIEALQDAFAKVHKQLGHMRRVHRITFGGSEDLGFAQEAGTRAAAGQGCPVMNGSLTV